MSEKWVLEDFNEVMGFLRKHHTLLSTYQHSPKILKNSTALEQKKLTLESKRLDQTLDNLSVKLKRSKSDLLEETIKILDELKSDSCDCVLKLAHYSACRVYLTYASRVYVNETNMNLVLQNLGKNPVIFIPSHKSFLDGGLLSLLMRQYNIDQIHIVSTTDVSRNKILRLAAMSSGAFFIRRTFINDELYTFVLKEYINTLMTSNYNIPLEGFIEGTRSKSNKGLFPKFGLMKFLLEPLFTGEVPDITFVPVNITYDRLSEEHSFMSELLGLPKMSYSKLFMKIFSMHEVNNIYFNVGAPFSAKKYLGISTSRSISTMKPLADQVDALEEKELVESISHEIVYRHKEFAFINTYNMIAVCIMMSLHESKPITINQLVKNVIKLTKTVRDFKGNVFDHDENNAESRIDEALKVHNTSVIKDIEGNIKLIRTNDETLDITKKFKGHAFNQKTVFISAPVIILQLYVNGIVPLLFPSLVICTVLNIESCNKEKLWNDYSKFRNLFQFEFIINKKILKKEFEDNLETLNQNLVVVTKAEKIVLGSNKDQFYTFINLMWPFIVCLQTVIEVFSTETSVEEKIIMIKVQRILESEMIEKHNVHPYSLTLDCIQNCFKGLTAENILKREFKDKNIIYHVNTKEINETMDWINRFSLNIFVDFSANNRGIVWG